MFLLKLYLCALAEQIVHDIQSFSSDMSAFKQIQIELHHDGPEQLKLIILKLKIQEKLSHIKIPTLKRQNKKRTKIF